MHRGAELLARDKARASHESGNEAKKDIPLLPPLSRNRSAENSKASQLGFTSGNLSEGGGLRSTPPQTLPLMTNPIEGASRSVSTPAQTVLDRDGDPRAGNRDLSPPSLSTLPCAMVALTAATSRGRQLAGLLNLSTPGSPTSAAPGVEEGQGTENLMESIQARSDALALADLVLETVLSSTSALAAMRHLSHFIHEHLLFPHGRSDPPRQTQSGVRSDQEGGNSPPPPVRSLPHKTSGALLSSPAQSNDMARATAGELPAHAEIASTEMAAPEDPLYPSRSMNGGHGSQLPLNDLSPPAHERALESASIASSRKKADRSIRSTLPSVKIASKTLPVLEGPEGGELHNPPSHRGKLLKTFTALWSISPRRTRAPLHDSFGSSVRTDPHPPVLTHLASQNSTDLRDGQNSSRSDRGLATCQALEGESLSVKTPEKMSAPLQLPPPEAPAAEPTPVISTHPLYRAATAASATSFGMDADWMDRESIDDDIEAEEGDIPCPSQAIPEDVLRRSVAVASPCQPAAAVQVQSKVCVTRPSQRNCIAGQMASFLERKGKDKEKDLGEESSFKPAALSYEPYGLPDPLSRPAVDPVDFISSRAEPEPDMCDPVLFRTITRSALAAIFQRYPGVILAASLPRTLSNRPTGGRGEAEPGWSPLERRPFGPTTLQQPSSWSGPDGSPLADDRLAHPHSSNWPLCGTTKEDAFSESTLRRLTRNPQEQEELLLPALRRASVLPRAPPGQPSQAHPHPRSGFSASGLPLSIRDADGFCPWNAADAPEAGSKRLQTCRTALSPRSHSPSIDPPKSPAPLPLDSMLADVLSPRQAEVHKQRRRASCTDDLPWLTKRSLLGGAGRIQREGDRGALRPFPPPSSSPENKSDRKEIRGLH